jgi:hypothetical protein
MISLSVNIHCSVFFQPHTFFVEPIFLGIYRQNIAAGDIKALIAFFETSQDMTCIEDVLHMIIRAVSQKPLLAAFLEQVNIINGCQVFVNLLQRYITPSFLFMHFNNR